MRACLKLETSLWLRSIQQPENCYYKKGSPLCTVSRRIRYTKVSENMDLSQERTSNVVFIKLSITNTRKLHLRPKTNLPQFARLGFHCLLFAIMVVRFHCDVDVAYAALLAFTLKSYALASTSGTRLSIALLLLLFCSFLRD